VLREQRFLLDFGERTAERVFFFVDPGLQVFGQLRGMSSCCGPFGKYIRTAFTY
jgi:hypothetical protein